MLHEDKGAVIYCDASARPNPGKIGLGVHGYIYQLGTVTKPVVVENYTHTVKGYVPSNKASEYKPIEPIIYFDYVGSSLIDGTNNQGEIQALIVALSNIEKHNVKYIHVLTDSEYVRKGVTEWCANWDRMNWIKQDGTPIINAEYWQHLYQMVNDYKAQGIQLEIEWVKGHNDIFGNTHADILSVIGMIHSTCGTPLDEFTEVPAKNYWKCEIDKHPFINFKRIYFNSVSEFNIAGHYFQAEPGGNDFIIGKRIPETGFAIVRLKEADNIIEEIKQKQCATDINAIVMIKLDRVYSKEVYPYLKKYGKNCLLNTKHNFNLNFVDNKPVTVEINPTGLSLRAIESFNYLEELFDKYNKYKEIGFDQPDNTNQLAAHDITHHFYDKVVKESKKEIKTKYSLKPEISVGFKNTKVNINILYRDVNKSIEIPLILGTDLLPRNSLKRIEDSNPKILLITWKESIQSLRYAVVIECDSGIGIWSNFFADKVFLN